MSSVLAWLIVAIVALPLALATATSAALTPDRSGFAVLSVTALLVLLAQPLVAAGLLKAWLSAIADARIGFGIAAVAMLAALIVDVMAGAALPAQASVPLIGDSWIGAIAAGLIVARAA